jgi:hypothetical protein
LREWRTYGRKLQALVGRLETRVKIWERRRCWVWVSWVESVVDSMQSRESWVPTWSASLGIGERRYISDVPWTWKKGEQKHVVPNAVKECIVVDKWLLQ